ncbi:MAG: hypothetical protein WD810_06550 [Solirubrobacterales bacterium]
MARPRRRPRRPDRQAEEAERDTIVALWSMGARMHARGLVPDDPWGGVVEAMSDPELRRVAEKALDDPARREIGQKVIHDLDMAAAAERGEL